MKIILKWVSHSGACISISYVVLDGNEKIITACMINKEYFEVFLEKGRHDGLAYRITAKEVFHGEYLTKKEMLARFSNMLKEQKISELDFYDEKSVIDFCGSGGAPASILKKFMPRLEAGVYKTLPDEFVRNFVDLPFVGRPDDLTLMRAFDKARDLVDRLADNFCTDDEKNLDDDAFGAYSKLRELVESANWCLPAITKKVKLNSLEKYPATLGAPFYCSDKLPWPKIDGDLCAPLFQFPLEVFRLLGGYSGSGKVIQCFESGDVGSRIVDDLDGMMIIAPQRIVDDIKDYRDGSNVDVITGFGQPRFDFGVIRYNLADDLAHLLRDEESLFLKMLSMLSLNAKSTPVKFMGSYRSIQKNQSDLGRCLFSITDDRIMNLGDAGGAQIYINDKGDLGAELSCY